MKRIISMLLCLLMLVSLSAAAFADDSQLLTMKMDRNGRTVYYENGEKVPGYVWEDVIDEFHRLRHNNPVNWDLFEYEEMTFSMDADGDVTALSQYILCKDGKKVETEDPNVAFIDSPTKVHATGAGAAAVTTYDAEGNALAVSNIEVTGRSFSSFVLTNKCGNCGEDQGSSVHFMSCGHFSCDVGREGHGDAGCWIAGHYKCDGGDHSYCYNCLAPVCNGKEHGAGVCPHVHNPVHFAWDKYPTCTVGGVERIICASCGYGAIIQVGPRHTFNDFGFCVFCGVHSSKAS